MTNGSILRRPTLSPYEMVYTNEHYYLICVPDHDPTRGCTALTAWRIFGYWMSPAAKRRRRSRRRKDAVYAFVGAPGAVVLHCDRAVLDDVLDRFGTDIQIFERDEQTFTAVLTTPPRGVCALALAIPLLCRGGRARLAAAGDH